MRGDTPDDLRRPPARRLPAGRGGGHAAGDPRRTGVLTGGSAEPAPVSVDGRGARRERRRHPLRERRARPRPRVRRAGRDPGRRRPVHELARGAAVDAARALAGHPGRGGVGDGGGARRALPAGAVVGAVGAARRRHLADRRGRGLLGAARAAPPTSARRHPGGRVGAERRAHRRAGDADLHRSRGRPPRPATAPAPPPVVLVALISTGAVADHGLPYTVGIIAFELVVGLVVGVAVGFGGAWLMRRAALPSSGLYPLAVLCLALLAYAASAELHASGFAAIYVAALVLGNSDLPHRLATRSFAEGVAWLAQIGLFVMLGLLLSPSRITPEVIAIAVAGSLLLTFVARPLTVWVSSVVQRLPWRERAFVSWAGLRGAVPIVLATIPLAEGVTDAERLFDIVFVIVVISTLLTGPTLPSVAKRLRVTRRSEPRSLDLEVAPLERVAADMLQVTISPVSRLHGVEVGELRLPAG